MTADCEVFVNALGERGPTRELARHAEVCPDCQPLWELEQALRHAHAGKPHHAPPMSAALQRALFEHRPTTRTTSFGTRTLSVLAVVSASIGLTILALPRPDLSLAAFAGLMPFALSLLLLLGLAVFAYRGQTGLGAPPWLRWAVPVASVVVFELLAALEEYSHGLAPKMDCLFLGTAIAGLVTAVSCAVSRRTALIAPAASGALAGSVAGLAALLCLRLHCPSLPAEHVMSVHVLPLLIAIGAGASAGRRWLSA